MKLTAATIIACVLIGQAHAMATEIARPTGGEDMKPGD